MALAVDDGRAFRRIAAEMAAEVGDEAILDEQAARLVAIGTRIDQAGVDENGRFADGLRLFDRLAHGASSSNAGRWADSASSTAMRTATPISTCSRMTLRE